MISNTRLAGSFVVGALLLTACGQQNGSDASAAGKNWGVHGGNLSNTRYSTLTEISPANIKTLGAAWKAEINPGISRNAVIVRDGVMFVAAGGASLSAGTGPAGEGGAGALFALNAKTGETIWKFVPEGAGISNLVKGAGAGAGKVFVGLSDAHVIAVDQKTGKLAWNTLVGADPLPVGEFIAAAPVYAEGVVLVGIGSGDAGISGRTIALDANTGKKLWEFRSIPAPGEAGHETWPADTDAWKQGGGGVWASQAVDPKLGLVFFGTGNAFPMQGGEVRAGDNLYTATVLAVDLKTGEHRWHFQMTRHEMWESDVGAPVVLYDATIDGKTVPAVAAMRVDGNIILLDRATGKPLYPMEERSPRQVERVHSAPKQIYPVGVDQVGFQCVQPDNAPAGFELGCFFDAFDYDTPNLMTPGSATRFAPMSYSPATKQFYITGSVSAGWARRAPDPYFFSGGSTQVPGTKSYGLLVAFDAATRKITWQKQMPRGIANGTGTTVTASGVLLHGEPDGNVQAYDAKTGDLLWQFQTGAPVAGPISVYEVDGKEYAAAVSGANVWSFALGGTVAQAQPRPQMAQGSGFNGRIVPTNEIKMSEELDSTISLAAKEKFKDDYALVPRRAKAEIGAKVTWVNNSAITRDVMAQDGSWSSGPIEPGKSATITFDKPGTYTYISKTHPWIYGELIVE